MFKKVIKIIPSRISFGKDEPRFKWNTLDDKLTGGRSSSKIEKGESTIIYNGIIRGINNSSWSCLRSNKIDQDISSFSGVKIKLRSDGRPYAFQIEYNEAWQEVKLSCSFQTMPNQWNIVDLKFNDFEHIQFGDTSRKEINKSVLDHVLRYNFYVADKSTGPFSLEIDYIQFY
jgi:NADH dehydrogenase [ubiquinone] 1 alpha subcomplex assembly factor 1